MKTVIVFNHPYEKSFCAAILESALAGLKERGDEVDLIHLDRDEFNPVMTARDLKIFAQMRAIQNSGVASDADQALAELDPQAVEYAARLREARHLVFIFPIWWELMPALTKGFVDKVIFPGLVYRYANSDIRMVSILPNIKKVTLITTMNTPSLIYRFLFGNAIRKALFTGTFSKIGLGKPKWLSFNMVKFVSPERRAKWLKRIHKQFAES